MEDTENFRTTSATANVQAREIPFVAVIGVIRFTRQVSLESFSGRIRTGAL